MPKASRDRSLGTFGKEIRPIVMKYVFFGTALLVAAGIFMAALWPAIASYPRIKHADNSHALLRDCGDVLLDYLSAHKVLPPNLDEAMKAAQSRKVITQDTVNRITAHYRQLTYFPVDDPKDSQPAVVILHLESRDKADFDLYSDFHIEESKK